MKIQFQKPNFVYAITLIDQVNENTYRKQPNKSSDNISYVFADGYDIDQSGAITFYNLCINVSSNRILKVPILSYTANKWGVCMLYYQNDFVAFKEPNSYALKMLIPSQPKSSNQSTNIKGIQKEHHSTQSHNNIINQDKEPIDSRQQNNNNQESIQQNIEELTGSDINNELTDLQDMIGNIELPGEDNNREHTDKHTDFEEYDDNHTQSISNTTPTIQTTQSLPSSQQHTTHTHQQPSMPQNIPGMYVNSFDEKMKNKEKIEQRLEKLLKLYIRDNKQQFNLAKYKLYLKKADSKFLQDFDISETDIIWSISKALRRHTVPYTQFSTPEMQNDLDLVCPSLMKKYWDNRIQHMLDILSTLQGWERKTVDVIDFSTWLAKNNI